MKMKIKCSDFKKDVTLFCVKGVTWSITGCRFFFLVAFEKKSKINIAMQS